MGVIEHMRKIKVDVERPRIEINGIAFEMRMSDGEIYHAGRAVAAACLRLNVADETAVLKTIQNVCSVVDDALGAGAMKRIFGNTPVSLPAALKVLNAIVKDCSDRYAEYIRGKYTGGARHGAIQPVRQ